MKILVIEYLPKKDSSNTKKILDAFFEDIGKHEVEILDLIEYQPDSFNSSNMQAYLKRNYMGENLNEKERDSIAKIDKMTAQFKTADAIVLASPMHNFSLPGPVKTYLDSILLKGETWDLIKDKYLGLMKGKKALFCTSSGGIYDKNSNMDHSTSLFKLLFSFMGFEDIKIVWAKGMSGSPKDQETSISNARSEIKAIALEWNK